MLPRGGRDTLCMHLIWTIQLVKGVKIAKKWRPRDKKGVKTAKKWRPRDKKGVKTAEKWRLAPEGWSQKKCPHSGVIPRCGIISP